MRDFLVSLLYRALSLCWRASSEPPVLPQSPLILVIKPCCLGDLLLATPALAALRQGFPRAHIAVLTSEWSRPAVQNNPNIDQIIDCGPLGQGFPNPRRYWRLAQELRVRQFHAAVVLDRSPLVSLLAFLAGIPIRTGIDSAGRGFSLTHRVNAEPLRHEAGLYMEVVEKLGGKPVSAALEFAPEQLLNEWPLTQLTADRDWVAVHPGGGVNPGSTLTGKRWPLERFAAVVDRLLQQDYGVVLVGGQEDAVLTRELTARNRSAAIVDLAGGTSLSELGALFDHCRAFLGNDTGPMHLAVAMGTPVVAVFGPSKPVLYGPYSSDAKVVYHGEQCEKCTFRGGLVTRCRNRYRCMAEASVDEVWQALQELLSEPRDWLVLPRTGAPWA